MPVVRSGRLTQRPIRALIAACGGRFGRSFGRKVRLRNIARQRRRAGEITRGRRR